MALMTAPLPSKALLAEYSGESLVAACAVLIALETIFVGLRFYARRLTNAEFGWDDVLVAAAWVTNMGLCITCFNSVYNAGVGRHLIAVEMKDPTLIVAWAKTLFAIDWLYLTSNLLPKVSVVLLYLRVFTNKASRMACYGLLVFLVAVWMSFVVAASLQCFPAEFQWNKKIPGGHCFNIQAYYESTSLPNIFSDLVIATLPLPTIAKLQTSWSRKIGLVFVFLAGSIGVIGSCIRVSTFFNNQTFVDNTWASVPLMTWSCVEPGMYLIAACLLSMRPLLQKIPLKAITTRLGGKGLVDSHTATHGRNKSKLGKAGFIEMNSRYDKYGSDKSKVLVPAHKWESTEDHNVELGLGFTSLQPSD